MMRSMFSGVSGLRVHQTKMDVIADNVANVNTVGFKSSRVTFNEVFSQLVSGAAGPNSQTGRGGVNAMQVGLGVGIASIDKIMTPGFSQRTDRSLDLMLDGSGFFVVGDNSGIYFTRAGAFDIDPQGNIVNPNGMILMGWDVDSNGQVQRTAVKPLNMYENGKQAMDPTATTSIEFSGNLNYASTPKHEAKIQVFDSIGNRYTMNVLLEYQSVDAATGETTWSFSFPADTGVDPATGTTETGVWMFLDGDEDRAVFLGDPAAATSSFDVVFNSAGHPVGNSTVNLVINNIVSGITPGATLGSPTTVTGDIVLGGTATAAGAGLITIDLSALTQHNSSASGRASWSNGNAPGVLAEFTVGPDGVITGRYSNGLTRVLGQIPVARFANPGGMQKVGNNLFVPTPNSGEFDMIGEEVGSDGSSIMGGVLEMSNVDLANEFTSIITTQRGFQANSRVITTSDEMLQELVNLKR